MVFLRGVLVLLFLRATLGFAESQSAALSDRIREGAWRSLVHSQQSRSIFWAQLLDPLDSEVTFLYRLAWLQVLTLQQKGRVPGNSGSRNLERASRPGVFWKWRWEGELWPDEEDAEENTLEGLETFRGERRLKKQAVDLSELPASLLQNLVQTQLTLGVTPGFLSEYVFKDYLTWIWARGMTIPLPEGSLVGPVSPDAIPTADSKGKVTSAECNWQALRILHHAEGAEKTEDLLQKCSAFTGDLSSALHFHLGDLYLKSAQADLAFRNYQMGLRELSKIEIPAGLKYRLTVSSLLSSESLDDFVFRMAYEVLNAGELNSTYALTLEKLVCDRLGQLIPQEGYRVFSKVFPVKTRIEQTLWLTRSCDPHSTANLWKSALPMAIRPRDRAKLLGKLLMESLSLPGFPEAERRTEALAQISRQNPWIASHEFWTAIRSDLRSGTQASEPSIKNQHNLQKLRSLVKLYRRSANWLDLDEEKLLSWNRKNGKESESLIPPEGIQSGILLERVQAKKVLQLPSVFLSLPPLVLNLPVQVDFVALLNQALRARVP